MKPLRSTLILIAVTAVVTASAFAAPAAPREFAPAQSGFQPQGESVLPYAPDRIMVRFTAKAMGEAQLDVAAQRGAKAASPTTGLATVDAILRGIGVTGIVRTYGPVADKAQAPGIDRAFTLQVPEGTDIPAAAARLAADPNLEYAVPDLRAFPAVAPNDPQYPDNWGHNNTAQLPAFRWAPFYSHTGAGVGTVGFDANAENAWNAPSGYGSAVIAILDSGVDTAHPDLAANLTTGYDFGDGDNNPMDDSADPGHGTSCAGVAAGVADNNLGIAGIGGHCTIMPLKVADSTGAMYFSYINNALYYAADNGADVVSMSFGASAVPGDIPSTDAALAYAYNHGVTLFAATGNENAPTISYPANHGDVIAVGAASPCGDRKRSSANSSDLNPGVNTDPNGYTCDGERWWGSNYGANLADANTAVDILAPTILPTTDISGSGGYQSGDYEPFFNGTSCATPYAAGVAALVKTAFPSYSPAQIRDRLTSTAIDIVNVESGAGWDMYSGYGMVDAEAAVGGGPIPPVADFTADVTSGCQPVTVNFTDLSTNSITGWQWDFGDGATDTVQNPTHQYTAGGLYSVTLIVTGPAGADTLTRVDYIDIGEIPTPDFTADVTTGVAPLDVNFTDLTTGAPTSWTWYFGDTTQSNLQNPTHTYTAAGDYTIALQVWNGCGTDITSKLTYIHVTAPPAPVASFSGTPTAGCAPLAVQFTDSSTGDITSWAWDFGDGGVDTLQNPQHTYTAPGTYDVALTVTGPGGSDTSTLTGYVTVGGPPVAAFSASDSSGIAPLSVTFTDESTGAPNAWAWDFGDGGSDTTQSPSHQYTLAGTYTVTLVVTNDCGSDTLTAVDLVTVAGPPAPVANFSADPVSGCAPLQVQFTDASTGDITSWAWNFGDGATDTTASPLHEYTTPGSYDVGLTVTGPGGSDNLTVTGLITVTGPPTAAFAMSDTVGTVPLEVTFSDLSTGNPTAWAWDFGDASTDTVQNPVHTYASAGTFTVTLIAGNACGADTTSLAVQVDAVPGPVAAFEASPTGGCAPLAVNFTDQSTGGVTAWNWDFGDATGDTVQNPSHVYATAGHYDVRLVVFGAGGSDTLLVPGMVTVDSLVTAAFSADAVEGANPFTVNFTDQSTGGPTSWAWDFGDGATDTLQSPSHTYTAAGLYTVTLTASGPCGADALVKTDYILVHTASAVGDVANARFELAGAYPNPFNPTTTIAFSLAATSHARLEVFDPSGRRIAVLVDQTMGPGEHRVTWQPFTQSSGVYFARLTAEGRSAVKRMVLVR